MTEGLGKTSDPTFSPEISGRRFHGAFTGNRDYS